MIRRHLAEAQRNAEEELCGADTAGKPGPDAEDRRARGEEEGIPGGEVTGQAIWNRARLAS